MSESTKPKSIRIVEDLGLGPVDENFGRSPKHISEDAKKELEKEIAESQLPQTEVRGLRE